MAWLPAPEILTVGLVLFSAVLHAGWNALAKSSGDPLANIAIVTGTCGALGLGALPFAAQPSAETARWLVFSVATHAVYMFALVRMYRLGDLSQVYPIARGLAPLGVALLAAIWAGEALAPWQLVGLFLASVAIVLLSGVASRRTSTRAARRASREAVWTAVLVAALIGTYTYLDGRGVRSVATPIDFIAWSFVLNAIPIGIALPILRGRKTGAALRSAGLLAVGGGFMGAIGYGIVLWAMSRTTMASVASLRESSVLFAALIGTQMLGEPFGRRRIWASALLVLGLILVQAGKR
jgi:drug/metabolite transporter (DMT)-like permease